VNNYVIRKIIIQNHIKLLKILYNVCKSLNKAKSLVLKLYNELNYEFKINF
jgi:hypothetical protein